MYTQVLYCLDRVPAVVKAKSELAKVEPFKTGSAARAEERSAFVGTQACASCHTKELQYVIA